MALVAWIAMTAVLLGLAAAAWVRTRLPDAPRCPRCHGVTVAEASPPPLGVLLEALTAGAARRCGRCGWAGRMRWRPALERAASNP